MNISSAEGFDEPPAVPKLVKFATCTSLYIKVVASCLRASVFDVTVNKHESYKNKL